MASRFLPASQMLPTMSCVPSALSCARNRLGSASKRNSRIRCCGSGWISERRDWQIRSEEHTSEIQSLAYIVCRLLLEKKKKKKRYLSTTREKDYWTSNNSALIHERQN